jgi:CDP-glycerol glycerophosphotransferase (TagB/SpsB family)
MTYTRAADIYLGDASSQIYEWIVRPRPAIFLDASGADWRGNADFAHWQLGDVVREITDLPAALDRALTQPDAYRAAQEAARSATFLRSDIPASQRAADAIVQWFQAKPTLTTTP